MKSTLISNPPYNMKWQAPAFAQIQPRFAECYTVPPENNANFAFILTGLEKNERCVFLLPCSVLSGGLKEEKAIREWLVEKNMVEAVILCPDNMFESTGISTCIIIFDKNKKVAGKMPAYTWLAESLRNFPNQDTIKSYFEAAGLKNCGYKGVGFGAATVYWGEK